MGDFESPNVSQTELPARTGCDDRAPWYAVVLVGLAIAILHGGILFAGFIMDDYVYLSQVRNLGWSDYPSLLVRETLSVDASSVWWTPAGELPYYRPLAILSFAIDYAAWGLNPFGFHLVNLLLHLFCAFLIWRIALRFFSRRWSAATAAIVFSLHPVHCEAVFWISGRFDLLVAAASMGSILSYMKWREQEQRSTAWVIASLFLYAVALACKETGIMVPVVIASAEILGWSPSGRARFPRSLWIVGAAYAGIGGAYFALRYRLFGGIGSIPPPYGVDLSSPAALIEILKSSAQYLLDFVFLIHVDVIYMAEFWAKHPLILAILSLLACGFAGWCAWRTGLNRVFRIGVVWAVAFTLPSLMAMPGERNVYLASCGIALAAAATFEALAKNAVDPTRSDRVSGVLGKAIVAAFVGVLCFEQAVMLRLTNASDRIYADLIRQAPDPPADAKIFVLNQCPINSVGFLQGVRIKYGRDDLAACALSLAPDFRGFSRDDVVQTGPRTVRLVRKGGSFFQSFMERFMLFSQPASALPDAARRFGLTLVEVPDTLDSLGEMYFELPHPIGDDRVVMLAWDNSRVRTRWDLIWNAPPPRLVPVETLRSDLAVAD